MNKESVVGGWSKVQGFGVEEWWKPVEEGDELVGVLGTKHDDWWEVTLSDGRVLGTPSHSALVSRLSEVNEGFLVRIVFTGMKRSSAGKDYYAYEVFTKPVVEAEE